MSAQSVVTGFVRNLKQRKWRYDRIVDRVVQPISTPFKPEPFDIVGADWDSLIVLDACRADLFESVAPIDEFAEYRRVNSPATSTQEWSRRVWKEDQLNTVYTTATPAVPNEPIGIFRSFENLWITSWDDESDTMLPGPVADRAREVVKQYPSMRHVVHFLQPHYPFVFADSDLLEGHEPSHEGLGWTIWDSLREGRISHEDCWRAYQQNLEGVLEVAMDLATDLPGRTVITSDHGNAMGEKPWWSPVELYNHPHDVWHPVLYEVPWAVIDGTNTSEGGDESDSVQDRLAALGYAD
ncbi:hypothetical protein [Halobaculum lipolyticum]|uniref:PglZ domain-containing protein n=1 Tax=Halobaculum lipolyticum TaxID=3032001 RepID=A0ABD5WHJ2_9EURY|nr:hypothetical protein [Halobaculum sp. DT31]